MEKINRPLLSEIPTLRELEENWEKWGVELRWSSFSRQLYLKIRKQLELLSAGHCSFCDDYPIGTNSTETIEHYFPKKEYFCLTYFWENLFYCCTKCQSEANKHAFEYTLKPDNEEYEFDDYFYYDNDSGELQVLENLEEEAPNKYLKANLFLERYGINKNPKRIRDRKSTFYDILNFLRAANSDDLRIRDDFEYRYIYDYAEKVYNDQIKQK